MCAEVPVRSLARRAEHFFSTQPFYSLRQVERRKPSFLEEQTWAKLESSMFRGGPFRFVSLSRMEELDAPPTDGVSAVVSSASVT